MIPKIFKTSLAVYTQADWDGENLSGWKPVNDLVLVKPDHLASKSKGGVEIPDDIIDRMTMAAEAGVVIEVGPRSTCGVKPGDRISMGRYSGQLISGHDGQTYRIVNDSEIGAIYGVSNG